MQQIMSFGIALTCGFRFLGKSITYMLFDRGHDLK